MQQHSHGPTGTRGRTRRFASRVLAVAGVVTMAAGLNIAISTTASAAETTVNGGALDWGLRSSFRSYIKGPIARGTITPADGATQKSGNGTFVFGSGSGTVDPAAGTAKLDYAGSVTFTGHDDGSGPKLKMTMRKPSLSVAGSTVTLSATVSSKSLDSGEVVDYGVIPFATFPIASGSSLTPGADKVVTLSTGAGKLTDEGVPAFANFYLPPDNDFVDPLTLTAQLGSGGSTPTEPTSPKVTVSKTVVDPAGDTVTVTGTGFDPALATGTRPPLAGKPAGVYVAFGTFLTAWKPSEGAPSSARKTGPQGTSVKWAVREADRATVGESESVTLSSDGSFTATLKVSEGFDGALANGNYGVYTYAGSGATAAGYETYTPLTFSAAPVGAVTGAQTIVAKIADTGGLTLSVAGDTVSLSAPSLSTDGSELTATGTLNPVRVTDLRAADPGWNVSGQLGDFASSKDRFDGKYLGWTPSVVSAASGQAVAPGAAVAAGTGNGLKSSAVLGSATAAKGRGTAVLGAGLSLGIPSETAPGTYSATLTLTVI